MPAVVVVRRPYVMPLNDATRICAYEPVSTGQVPNELKYDVIWRERLTKRVLMKREPTCYAPLHTMNEKELKSGMASFLLLSILIVKYTES